MSKKTSSLRNVVRSSSKRLEKIKKEVQIFTPFLAAGWPACSWKDFFRGVDNVCPISKFFDMIEALGSWVTQYSGVRLRRDTYLRGKTFPLFQPSSQRFFGTNDTSFKSPNIGRLESAKKLVVASS